MSETITLQQLKRMLIEFYYPKHRKDFIDRQMERKLIITEIRDCYNSFCTTIFSINGSPPRGIAVLERQSYASEWVGNLIILGNGKVGKKKYDVEILREEENDGFSKI